MGGVKATVPPSQRLDVVEVQIENVEVKILLAPTPPYASPSKNPVEEFLSFLQRPVPDEDPIPMYIVPD